MDLLHIKTDPELVSAVCSHLLGWYQGLRPYTGSAPLVQAAGPGSILFRLAVNVGGSGVQIVETGPRALAPMYAHKMVQQWCHMGKEVLYVIVKSSLLHMGAP